MNAVEQIQNLQNLFESDDKFCELKEALEQYHQMIEDGVLSPRGNCLMNNYTTFVSESNLNYSNIK